MTNLVLSKCAVSGIKNGHNSSAVKNLNCGSLVDPGVERLLGPHQFQRILLAVNGNLKDMTVDSVIATEKSNKFNWTLSSNKPVELGAFTIRQELEPHDFGFIHQQASLLDRALGPAMN